MGLLDRLRGPQGKQVAGQQRAIEPAPSNSSAYVASKDAFLAIDFETATAQRGSACAVGLALFDGGSIKHATATLIDPGVDPEEWNPFNIMIHGIEPEDVQGAPSFANVWTEVERAFPGVPLVAHNAAFDMSVLRAEFGRSQLRPSQTIRYTCSASMSRCAWPAFLSVSLPIVAEELGIELDHHEPGSDARASGEILLRAVEALGASDLDDAFKRTGRRWGQINPELAWINMVGSLKAKEFAAHDDTLDHEHPLYGKTIVFTGTLHSMTRREAFQTVANVGATPGDGVTKATNILVVGEQDIARLAAGENMSAKQRRAAGLRHDGQDIQLVGEMDFIRML